MKKISKAIDRIDVGMAFFEKNLATVMFAAMFIVFVINIVFRYFFKAILWGYELSLLLFSVDHHPRWLLREPYR